MENMTQTGLGHTVAQGWQDDTTAPNMEMDLGHKKPKAKGSVKLELFVL